MKSHRSFTTTCLEKTLIAPSVYEIRCQKPTEFSFQPGQFVLFDVPLPENNSDIQPRAYSIASTPTETDLLFVIKLVPNGRASRWIAEILDVGMPIHMQGPFGNFLLDTQSEKPYLFIGTGTGIAPLRSQILSSLRERNDHRSMYLLFGVLKPEDLFWEQEWKDIEKEWPNFHAHISFLSGEADWHGNTGSIQERLPHILRMQGSPHIYMCGSPDIIKALREQCLALGVPKTDVHFESYI